MRFKLDENLPVDLAETFQRAGHDVLSVIDQELGGEPDQIIARFCQQEQRILITLDLDFADIRAYPPRNYSGIVVFRLKRQDKLTVLVVGERLLKAFQDSSLEKQLWIVDEGRIRIRE